MPFVIYLLMILTTLSGCATGSAERARGVGLYQPRNIYKVALPAGFERVVLLPMVCSPQQGTPASLQGIENAIVEELGKAKRFELLQISRDRLQEISGMSQIAATDVWPYKLKKALEEKQVDGIFVVELTQLKGYHPIALGLKMRLVGLADGKTYWSADDVFDAGSPAVYSAAKKFEEGMLMTTRGTKTETKGTIEISPAKFAKYAAYTFFQTLPEVPSRAERKK